MFDAYFIGAAMTAGYVLGRHHEAGNDSIKYMWWSLAAGAFWPAWLVAAAYYGIREGQ